jgi:hypothetical protein
MLMSGKAVMMLGMVVVGIIMDVQSRGPAGCRQQGYAEHECDRALHSASV